MTSESLPPSSLSRRKAMFALADLVLLSACGGTADPNCKSNVALDSSLSSLVGNGKVATKPDTLTALPVGTAGAVQTRGYVEYVPPGYSSKCKWPVIICLHGDGEFGDGKSAAALQPFWNMCLTYEITANNWDAQKRFIVLAPQFSSYEDRSADNVNAFIQFAKANYAIDTTRIYLTAVSGGGVALGNYLNKYSGGEAAAVLPVACYVPPVSLAGVSKWKNVPVWLLCGSADTTVGVGNVMNVDNYLVTANAPVSPRVTLFTGFGHQWEVASDAYSPATNTHPFDATNGTVTLTPYANIYDWLLQYHR